jgi:hypothetical protein
MMESNRKVEILGHYGALLSVIEVGLGSLLHSLHIPFAGLFLSLNQGYLLCRVALKLPDERWAAYAVSNISAVLKSLAPAGQKLGPMLSLSMQGLLFNLGILLLGVNPIGLSVGMVLLSFWSFVQPLVTYYIFFGEKLFNAAQFLYEKTLPWHGLEPRHLGLIFISIVALKAVAAIALALFAWKSKGQELAQEAMIMAAKKPSRPMPHLSPLLMALRDLTRPLFLVSLAITALFLFYAQHSWAQIIWYLLRPLAIAFGFFYISRTLTLDRWLDRLEESRYQHFAQSCRLALVKIRRVI